MFTTTPLFGKFHSSLKPTFHALAKAPLLPLQTICNSWIDSSLLEPNQNERKRLFPPHLTFLAFLNQVLNPGSSCRAALQSIEAYYQKQSEPCSLSTDTSGYCQARARWSVQELVDIRQHISDRVGIHANSLFCLLNIPNSIKVIDGTTINLPDTASNRKEYPQSGEQLPGCGFPLLRCVGIFCLKTGVLLNEANAPYKVSENALFQQLWPTFDPGDIVVGDRLFGSYGSIGSLKESEVDSIFRHNSTRKCDLRNGKILGIKDRLQTWVKPARQMAANMSPEQWEKLPQTMKVRVIKININASTGRNKKLVLTTTLLDPVKWPAWLIAQLYLRRWKVELYWDDIKTTLQMDMLSCLSPEMVQKEYQMHLIAYNLIRAIMSEVAMGCHVPLDRISFKGTIDAANKYGREMDGIAESQKSRRRKIYMAMLCRIGKDLVPDRPGRREPRCQKKRPKAYPFLTCSRRKMKDAPKQYPSKNKSKRLISPTLSLS